MNEFIFILRQNITYTQSLCDVEFFTNLISFLVINLLKTPEWFSISDSFYWRVEFRDVRMRRSICIRLTYLPLAPDREMAPATRKMAGKEEKMAAVPCGYLGSVKGLAATEYREARRGREGSQMNRNQYWYQEFYRSPSKKGILYHFEESLWNAIWMGVRG